MKDITLSENSLGSGRIGTVYAVKNRPDLVVKVPRNDISRRMLSLEAATYSKLKYLDIIAPTEIVTLSDGSTALLRPKLKNSI